MPVMAITTAANGDQRQQVLPMLNRIRVASLKRGNPKRRPRVLAADKGYDAKWLRHKLRSKGIRPQIKKRQWNGKKLLKGRPIREVVPCYKLERSILGFNVNTGGLLFVGSPSKCVSMLFFSLLVPTIWFPKLVG